MKKTKREKNIKWACHQQPISPTTPWPHFPLIPIPIHPPSKERTEKFKKRAAIGFL